MRLVNFSTNLDSLTDIYGKRLRAFFGSDSSLRVTSGESEYTVELRFPYVKERS